jgi:hypothetical protein
MQLTDHAPVVSFGLGLFFLRWSSRAAGGSSRLLAGSCGRGSAPRCAVRPDRVAHVPFESFEKGLDEF